MILIRLLLLLLSKVCYTYREIRSSPAAPTASSTNLRVLSALSCTRRLSSHNMTTATAISFFLFMVSLLHCALTLSLVLEISDFKMQIYPRAWNKQSAVVYVVLVNVDTFYLYIANSFVPLLSSAHFRERERERGKSHSQTRATTKRLQKGTKNIIITLLCNFSPLYTCKRVIAHRLSKWLSVALLLKMFKIKKW